VSSERLCDADFITPAAALTRVFVLSEPTARDVSLTPCEPAKTQICVFSEPLVGIGSTGRALRGGTPADVFAIRKVETSQKPPVMSKTLAKIAATMSPMLGNMMFDPRRLIHSIDYAGMAFPFRRSVQTESFDEIAAVSPGAGCAPASLIISPGSFTSGRTQLFGRFTARMRKFQPRSISVLVECARHRTSPGRIVQRARARRPRYRSDSARCTTGSRVCWLRRELVRREISEARVRASFVGATLDDLRLGFCPRPEPFEA
jgi:hypothetical protein